jgi:hypothetical protein
MEHITHWSGIGSVPSSVYPVRHLSRERLLVKRQSADIWDLVDVVPGTLIRGLALSTYMVWTPLCPFRKNFTEYPHSFHVPLLHVGAHMPPWFLPGYCRDKQQKDITYSARFGLFSASLVSRLKCPRNHNLDPNTL